MNPKSNTLRDVLGEGKSILKSRGAEQYSLDAELFMMKTLGITKVQLFTKDNDILSQEKIIEFGEMIKKRAEGVPAQYILGKCEFMGMDFEVNPSVLIPRPDTEILVERILTISKKENYKTFLDMCTGSGCIAVSLAKHGDLSGTAVDISGDALEVAKKNAFKNSVSEKIVFLESDLFNSLNTAKKYDIIVSNPPYIETEAVKTLMREVRDNEPYIALDGGEDGLCFYREIIKNAPLFLNKKGLLAFEIGYNQDVAVKNIMEKEGFEKVTVEKDLSGLDRVVFGFMM